tara:strand:- start:1899 stop:2447 length:549 start_codon:yes stop_codon:yes gene_type:complete
MNYFIQTKRLLELYSDKNTNFIRHFFSELQQLRQLYSIALINAITAGKNPQIKNEYELIEMSITREKWMKQICLLDIRNIVVFVIRKEFNTLINIQPYIKEGETDEAFLQLDKVSTLGVHVKKLQTLIETCYYISHIFYITRTPEIINENNWKMFHDYLFQTPLTDSVKHIYLLLKNIIQVR